MIKSVSDDNVSKVQLGTFANGWTYVQFEGVHKGIVIKLKLIQDGEL